jgi:hypothetical protein
MRRHTAPEQVFAQLDGAWLAACNGRALPARADINPARAGGALHYAALVDVVRDRQHVDFRYRLLGQHLIEGYGRNLTGSSQLASFGDLPQRPFYDALVRCAETRAPQRALVEFENHNGTPCHARAHAWPLSDDGETVTGLLIGFVYVSAPETHAT